MCIPMRVPGVLSDLDFQYILLCKVSNCVTCPSALLLLNLLVSYIKLGYFMSLFLIIYGF